MKWPVLAFALTLGAAEPAQAGRDDADLAESLARLPPDPPPASITNDKHYVVSNERRLDFFAPEIRDVGGVHIGVGSDPNYLLAGWARSELVVIVDFDQDVVDLHAIHILFLACATDGGSYRRLWNTSTDGEALIALRFPNPLIRVRMLELYRRSRREIARRIDIMQTKLEMAGETWFLDEIEDFAHVRQLASAGRIIAVRGDFTQPGVVRAIGQVLREADRQVGSLYLSNIEQYFMYTANYRANIKALPLHAGTAVLRTLPGKPAGFEYISQRGDSFHRWIDYKHAYSVYRVRGLGKGEKLTASEFFRIEADPPN